MKAIYNCSADHPDELTFCEGEVIVVDGEEDSEWWVSALEAWWHRPRRRQEALSSHLCVFQFGHIENEPSRRGVFPVTFVHFFTDWCPVSFPNTPRLQTRLQSPEGTVAWQMWARLGTLAPIKAVCVFCTTEGLGYYYRRPTETAFKRNSHIFVHKTKCDFWKHIRQTLFWLFHFKKTTNWKVNNLNLKRLNWFFLNLDCQYNFLKIHFNHFVIDKILF